jgi:hypothetical protein
MLTGTPLSATLTTTQKGDPAIYVSVKADADGYVYGSTFTLTSENARELSKKVLAYLGYNAASDKDFSKIASGDNSVDTSKTIEFDLKETIANDGKTYKNLVFPTLNSVSGKPKNMLTKENATMLIATHNLKDFFSSIKSEVANEELAF